MYVRKCERERNSGGTGSLPVRIAEDRRREVEEEKSAFLLLYYFSEERFIQVCYTNAS